MSAKCEVCGVVTDIDEASLAGGRVEFTCVGCDTPHWATRNASGRLPRGTVLKRARASRPPVDDAPVPDSTRLDDLRALAERSAVSASSLPPPRLGAPPALLSIGGAPNAGAAGDFATPKLDDVAPPSVREAIRASAPPLSDPGMETFARDVDAGATPSSRRLGARSSRAGVAALACAALLFGTGSALSARLGPDRGVASPGAGASVTAAAHSATFSAFDVDVVTGAARKAVERDSAALPRTAAAETPAAPPRASSVLALNKQAAPAKKQRVEKSATASPKTLAEAMAEATRPAKK